MVGRSHETRTLGARFRAMQMSAVRAAPSSLLRAMSPRNTCEVKSGFARIVRECLEVRRPDNAAAATRRVASVISVSCRVLSRSALAPRRLSCVAALRRMIRPAVTKPHKFCCARMLPRGPMNCSVGEDNTCVPFTVSCREARDALQSPTLTMQRTGTARPSREPRIAQSKVCPCVLPLSSL